MSELQSGSEGDDTVDEDEADEESEGRIRFTEMECEGQLVEGCSQKELIRSGEAHPLLARSDDADFLPFRSAGAMRDGSDGLGGEEASVWIQRMREAVP